MRKTVALTAAMAASLLATQANANLILDQSVGASFGAYSTTTSGNDWVGRPGYLLLGQLAATANGYVDFYYVGNEAGYTNTLRLDWLSPGDNYSHSTVGLPDTFSTVAGASYRHTIEVTASTYVDFGFCTDGGSSVGSAGFCAYNADQGSLIQQYDFGNIDGYRSIGFRALDASNNWIGGTGPAAAWGIFWDDSGAANDDNHDDYIAIARFRPVSVPEPGTTLLLGLGLLGAGLARRLRSRKS